MNKATIIFLIAVFIFIHGCSSPVEKQQPYDMAKVGMYKELVFHETSLRGIKNEEGVVYYVEKDLRNLSAYKDGNLLWRVDVIATCGDPGVGAPEIRHIGLRKDTIDVTYGKHSYAVVDRHTGKATFWGAD